MAFTREGIFGYHRTLLAKIQKREETMLLNIVKAAKATGFSRSFIDAIKAAARGTEDDPFRGGRFTTKALLEEWIVNHPEFRAYLVWKKKKTAHP